MSKTLLALGLLFLTACSELIAATPENLNNADQYMRIGGAGTWARQWSTPTTSGTAGLVLYTPGDNTYAAGDPLLVTWGTSLRISCQAEAHFMWTMDTGITFAASGLITDGGTTGPGPSFRVEAGTYVEDMPLRSSFAQGRNFRRTGFCTGTAARFLGAPCDADGDCPSGACRGESNGSCTESGVNYCQGSSSNPFDYIRGAFLQSLSESTATDCYITEVR